MIIDRLVAPNQDLQNLEVQEPVTEISSHKQYSNHKFQVTFTNKEQVTVTQTFECTASKNDLVLDFKKKLAQKLNVEADSLKLRVDQNSLNDQDPFPDSV